MFFIKLSNSDLLTAVDADILEKEGSKIWSLQKNGYVTRSVYLGKIDGKYISKTYYLHREIINPTIGLQVDHIDGDKLNNLRANLRACNNQQNNRNTKSRRGSSSKFKGVSWDKSNKKWCAKICIGGGKHIAIGRFISEIDAAIAYDVKARIHHGEFAFLNFPHKTPPSS